MDAEERARRRLAYERDDALRAEQRANDRLDQMKEALAAQMAAADDLWGQIRLTRKAVEETQDDRYDWIWKDLNRHQDAAWRIARGLEL